MNMEEQKSKSHWLEISLTVESELAEAVVEVLTRYVSNGVVVESGVVYNDAEDEGTPVDPVRVYGYLPTSETLEEKRQRVEEALWHLGQIKPLPAPTYRVIEDEDWMAAWKKHYRPIPVGKRLLVLPAWYEHNDTERVAVRIDPSMAFGTGTHPSTQLCLEMVEQYVQPGHPVIDIGCGSGILSIAALKLGASHALGVDIDEASILASQENASLNDVAIETLLGSVAEIQKGASLQQAPLVVANILAPVIIRLFDAGLSNLLSPDGVMILSGILDVQAMSVIQAADQYGLHLLEEKKMGDWVALGMKF